MLSRRKVSKRQPCENTARTWKSVNCRRCGGVVGTKAGATCKREIGLCATLAQPPARTQLGQKSLAGLHGQPSNQNISSSIAERHPSSKRSPSSPASSQQAHSNLSELTWNGSCPQLPSRTMSCHYRRGTTRMQYAAAGLSKLLESRQETFYIDLLSSSRSLCMCAAGKRTYCDRTGCAGSWVATKLKN